MKTYALFIGQDYPSTKVFVGKYADVKMAQAIASRVLQAIDSKIVKHDGDLVLFESPRVYLEIREEENHEQSN